MKPSPPELGFTPDFPHSWRASSSTFNEHLPFGPACHAMPCHAMATTPHGPLSDGWRDVSHDDDDDVLEPCTALFFWLFFPDAPAPGIVRAEVERFPSHAAQASRPLSRSRKAVHIPGLTPRRATSRMAPMPLLVDGPLRWYRSSLASRVCRQAIVRISV
jgi:hypothetical protein